ncbi:MAG: hypothetical protein JKY52_05890 [Flavobacteriales bacterium]|nr:hypothetical protein [Flavobacteriales bacterium]
MRCLFLSGIVLLMTVLCGFSQEVSPFTWNGAFSYEVNIQHLDEKDPTQLYLEISDFKGKQSKANFRQLIEWLFNTAISRETTVYSPIGYGCYSRAYFIGELQNVIHIADTARKEDFLSGEWVKYIHSQDITVNDVTDIYLNQEWYYNDKEKKIEVKITDWALMVMRTDEQGRPLGKQTL